MKLLEEARIALDLEKHEKALAEVKYLLREIERCQVFIQGYRDRIDALENGAEPSEYDPNGDRIKRR